MEDFGKPFDMMLQKERVKQLSSGLPMGGYSLSILVKIKSTVNLPNTYYHSLFTSGAFNVPTESFNLCFSCDVTDHGICIFHHKK